MRTWVAQMRKGLVELCVLTAVRRHEAYGYEILQRLGRQDALAISESAVYPILARLTEEGALKVRSAPSPAGPPRRYYRLTPLGQARLREMSGYWKAIVAAIDELSDEESVEEKTEKINPKS
jgi:PadR family transcriptional regulator, regulatory protein PadR